MVGTEAPTERETLEVFDPAEFVAVTVYEVEVRVAVGVPLITHVELLILRVPGRAGETVQFVIAAPLVARVVGETDIAAPTGPEVPAEPE